jgi:hypothetical protein
MVILNEPSCSEWRSQALAGLKFPEHQNHVAQIWVALAPLLSPDLAEKLMGIDGADTSSDMAERLKAGHLLLEGVRSLPLTTRKIAWRATDFFKVATFASVIVRSAPQLAPDLAEKLLGIQGADQPSDMAEPLKAGHLLLEVVHFLPLMFVSFARPVVRRHARLAPDVCVSAFCWIGALLHLCVPGKAWLVRLLVLKAVEIVGSVALDGRFVSPRMWGFR